MEIKIPKEVRQHKETIFFGLSARQFFCAAVAVGLAVGVYLGLHFLGGGDNIPPGQRPGRRHGR